MYAVKIVNPKDLSVDVMGLSRSNLIVGPSGCGKSTVLRSLLSMSSMSRSEITFMSWMLDGANLNSWGLNSYGDVYSTGEDSWPSQKEKDHARDLVKGITEVRWGTMHETLFPDRQMTVGRAARRLQVSDPDTYCARVLIPLRRAYPHVEDVENMPYSHLITVGGKRYSAPGSVEALLSVLDAAATLPSHVTMVIDNLGDGMDEAAIRVAVDVLLTRRCILASNHPTVLRLFPDHHKMVAKVVDGVVKVVRQPLH